MDYFRTYGSLLIALATIIVSLVAQWAVFGTRLTAAEQREDRQGTAITALQNTLTQQQADYAALSAKIDGISDNVSYIRSRIDHVSP